MDIFWQRMTLIAYLFLRLRRAKNVVRYMCKKYRFRLPFQKELRKRVSTLFKFERQHLYHIYWATGRQFSYKKSLFLICNRLRLFVNRMSAVHKCSLPNKDNLMQPIHMQLSEKHLSTALIVLRNSFKLYPITKRNFLQLNCLPVDQ